MKKLIYIGALSALLLTACASEKAEGTDNTQEELDKAKEKEAEQVKKKEEKKVKEEEKLAKKEEKEAKKEEERKAKEAEKKAKEEEKLKEEQADKEKEAKEKAEKEAKKKTEAKEDLTKEVTKLINKKLGKTNNLKKDSINSIEIKDKELFVVLNGNENFSKSMTKKGMWMDSKKVLEPLNKMNEFDKITIQWYYPFVDTYGNEKDELVMSFDIDKANLNKINWDNFSTDNLPKVVNNYFEHAALKE